MKKFTFVLIVLIIGFSNCKSVGKKDLGGDGNLVGEWEIIEFRLIGQGGDPVSDEETLRNAGAVWDLKFSRNGDFRQSFNMRQRDMTMEVEEGTWKTSGDSLKIELQIDTITSNLYYTYKINQDVLTLTMAPQEVNSKIITKFREK